MKDLMPYDDNSEVDLLSDTSNVYPFAKAVGDFKLKISNIISIVALGITIYLI
ncbi:MAG: hypothetical protein ACI4IE_05070 [Eubacterium sp.]